MGMLRRRYIIHRSVQVKYMVMVVLPIVIVGMASIYTMRSITKFSLAGNRERLITEIGFLQMGLQSLDELAQDPKRLSIFKGQLAHLRDMAKNYILINTWAWQKIQEVIIVDILILVLGGLLLALIFSHRIVGPVYRVRQYIEMLSKGQGIPPVKVRGYDEFKELAGSLENLRKFLTARREQVENSIKDLEGNLSRYRRTLEEKEIFSADTREKFSNIEKNLEHLRSLV